VDSSAFFVGAVQCVQVTRSNTCDVNKCINPEAKVEAKIRKKTFAPLQRMWAERKTVWGGGRKQT